MLSLPSELIERILADVEPASVLAFEQCSRAARHHALSSHLWSILYLSLFDTPQAHPACDYRALLIRRLKAALFASHLKPAEDTQKFVLDCFLDLVAGIISSPSYLASPDLAWLTDILAKTRFLDIKPAPRCAFLHARLRSYVGLSLTPLDTLLSTPFVPTSLDDITPVERRTKSRTQVYDLRNYRRDNSWGPYLLDGKINWVHVEALINVILFNLAELPMAHSRPYGSIPRPPTGLEATRAYSAPGCDKPSSPSCTPAADWAGVQGTWRRYVSFMDYRDLFAFNYSPATIQYSPTEDTPPSSPVQPASPIRDPSFFEQPSFLEATRLLELQLRIVDPSQMRFRPLASDFHDVSLQYNYRRRSSSPYRRSASPSRKTPLEQYKPIYFSGTSRGASGAPAPVEGVVTMGADGIPRWRFFTISESSPRWTSEGVQVGEIGSAMGIVGAWSTNTHDRGDPVGPFWMWKISAVTDDLDAPASQSAPVDKERGRLFDFTERVVQLD